MLIVTSVGRKFLLVMLMEQNDADPDFLGKNYYLQCFFHRYWWLQIILFCNTDTNKNWCWSSSYFNTDSSNLILILILITNSFYSHCRYSTLCFCFSVLSSTITTGFIYFNIFLNCPCLFSQALLLARSNSTSHSAMSSVWLSVDGRTPLCWIDYPPTPCQVNTAEFKRSHQCSLASQLELHFFSCSSRQNPIW